MFKKLFHSLRDKLYHWISYEPPSTEIPPYDFNRLRYELRPGDVLLIEGRSRISHIIRTVTQSSWTHAVLYIGRLVDFDDEETQKKIQAHIDTKDNVRLIIEDLLDKGTVVSKLSSYRDHHIRICRPVGIAPNDVQLVIRYTIESLGQPYNVRQLLDLARFLLPWSLLPRRWGSSLFRTATGEPESGVCSSLIAKAFNSVQFPILPFVRADQEQGFEVIQRNPYLFTPKDFDYSPYFEIIKYPLFNPNEPLPYYRRLPWVTNNLLHQDHGMVSSPTPKKQSRFAIFKKQDSAQTEESVPPTITPVKKDMPNQDEEN